MTLFKIDEQVCDLFEQADVCAAQRRWAAARAIYNQIIARVPAYAPAYVQRGLLSCEQGRLDHALHDFQRALALDPRCGMAYGGRSDVLSRRGQHHRALQDAYRGLELDPDNAALYYRRIGAAYRGLGQLRRALSKYNRALALNPDDDQTLLQRGQCYEQIQLVERALADYERALALHPGWAQATRARARARRALRRPGTRRQRWLLSLICAGTGLALWLTGRWPGIG